ncbi:unnamed protein product [Caretta caretta]
MAKRRIRGTCNPTHNFKTEDEIMLASSNTSIAGEHETNIPFVVRPESTMECDQTSYLGHGQQRGDGRWIKSSQKLQVSKMLSQCSQNTH